MIYPSLKRNRQHAHRMSFAATCSEEEGAAGKTVPFAKVKWSNAAQLDTAVATVYNGIASKRGEVPCGSLTPVIQDLFDNAHVHVFFLDVTGSEHMVLQHIDFSKVTIDLLVVDYFQGDCLDKCDSRKMVQDIMERAGYHWVKDRVPKNDLFIRSNSEFAQRAVELGWITSEIASA